MSLRTLRLGVVGIALALAACQHSTTTDFPPGLEPLEPNPIPAQEGGTPTEGLRTQVDTTDYIHIYGRGYVLESTAATWAAMQDPDADVALCSTNQQIITPNNDDDYDFSFLVHYVVNNVVTVEWDDQWVFGTVDGPSDAPILAMAKHQKIDGSSFITLSEGTVQITSTDDPNVSELEFVEHLNAISGSSDQVLAGVQHNYDSILSVAHGGAVSVCPQ